MAVKNAWVYVGISLATSFWGMSFLWTGQLLNLHFPLYSLIFFRLLIAACLLFISLGMMHKLQRPKRKDAKWFLLMALFEPFLYFVGETNGIKLTGSPTIASVVIATIPLFTLAAGYYFFRERLTRTNIAGMMISVFGVLLAMLNDDFSIGVHPLGVALLFLAVFTAVGYSVVIRRLAETYNSFTIVTIQNILGTIYFLPLFMMESEQIAGFYFSWESIYPLLMLAIFPSCVAFLFYVYTIKTLGVSKTNMFTTLTPLVTMLLAFFIGQEDLNARKGAGALLAVTGLLLSQWTRARFKEAAPLKPME